MAATSMFAAAGRCTEKEPKQPATLPPLPSPAPCRGRQEWEAAMETFGVSADIDAMSRRRRVKMPTPEETKAQIRRRAAMYGDIIDISVKKHFDVGGRRRHSDATGGARERAAMQSVDIDACRRRRPMAEEKAKRKAANGALPWASSTYDMLKGERAGHRYFDGISRSYDYAELIGRPGAERPDEEGLQGALLELAEGQALPLSFRRVLDSMLPAWSHPDFRGTQGDQLRQLVQRRVAERCAITAPGKGMESSFGCTEETVSTADVGYLEGGSESLLDDSSMGNTSREEFGMHLAAVQRMDEIGKHYDMLPAASALAMSRARSLPPGPLPMLLGNTKFAERQALQAEKEALGSKEEVL